MTTNSNTPRAIFENRRDAGRRLAIELSDYGDNSVVVLAIPNGGVLVGVEVANALEAEFDLIVCRKIPTPLKPEAGFGAITADGTMILNDALVKSLGLSQQQIEYEASKVRLGIKKRSMLYRGERPLTSVSGRTVIIVDDGLASGYTMRAAVESVRLRRPREIVVGVPCASAMAVQHVEKVVDKLVAVALGYAPRFAVADFYSHWYDVRDDEIARLLKQWRALRSR